MSQSFHLRNAFLAAVLLLLFALPSSALAQGIIYGDTIPAKTVVDADVILIGQNISIEGTVNGNVFILGNQVKIGGQINGSLIVIGQNLSISGSVDGGTYALGLTLELAPGAALERDLYVLSVGLSSGKGADIQRDLYALGLDAGLNGTVGRDLHTAIGPIQLYNGLMRLLGFEELTLRLHFELPPPAPETPPASEATPSARLLHASRARLSAQETGPLAEFDWTGWGTEVGREWIVLGLIGLLAFWLARPTLDSARDPLVKRPWRTGASGLVVLVVTLNLFVLAALVGGLVFSLGLALNYIGLWQLSIALWIASYALLALACVALWFFIVYGAKVIAVYALSGWAFAKLNPSGWMKAVALVVGTLVYALLHSVPIVGWIVAVLVTAAGMGTTWSAYRSHLQSAAPPEPEVLSTGSRKKKATKA